MDPMQNVPKMTLPPVGNDSEQQNQPALASQPMQPATISADNNRPSAPAIADDVDLIEKEWVAQIKEIIQKTANDPYERTRQLTLLKNEYLQKRYNKNVNIS